MPDKIVGDRMHQEIIACRPDTPMTKAARFVPDTDVHAIEPDQLARLAAARMLESGVQRLLVLESDQDHARPIGIVSATDLVKGMRGARWTWHIG